MRKQIAAQQDKLREMLQVAQEFAGGGNDSIANRYDEVADALEAAIDALDAALAAAGDDPYPLGLIRELRLVDVSLVRVYKVLIRLLDQQEYGRAREMLAQMIEYYMNNKISQRM